MHDFYFFKPISNADWPFMEFNSSFAQYCDTFTRRLPLIRKWWQEKVFLSSFQISMKFYCIRCKMILSIECRLLKINRYNSKVFALRWKLKTFNSNRQLITLLQSIDHCIKIVLAPLNGDEVKKKTTYKSDMHFSSSWIITPLSNYLCNLSTRNF